MALATIREIGNQYKDQTEYVVLYSYIFLFCCLKKETVGFDISPLEVMLIYTNDIMEKKNFKIFLKAKSEYEKICNDINSKMHEVPYNIGDTFIDPVLKN